MTLKCVVLGVFTCFQMQLYGQLMMDDINLEQIQQRKVRKYIESEIKEGKHQISDIQSSWNSGNDLSSFSKKEMTFFLRGNLEDIWRGYVSADPTKSWNGLRVSFGVLLQKFPNNIFYDRDSVMGIDTGQVYFLDLKLMLGIYNVPVAFEIITVNPKEKMIEFSYIEGNKSLGVQQIQFFDVDGENTEIRHISYYKSDSRFRDRWIYPFFHKKIINDFHRNMRRLLILEKYINK